MDIALGPYDSDEKDFFMPIWVLYLRTEAHIGRRGSWRHRIART